MGLERLAEDGDPSAVLAEWEGIADTEAGVFEVPVGDGGAGSIGPGERYEFVVSALPGDHLSLSSMIVATNDVVWSTDPSGLPLFDDGGSPLDQDATSLLELYDVGSEAQQAPAGGGYQPLGGLGVDSGSDESGQVQLRLESTRALPTARRLVDVRVQLEPGTTNYTVTVENIAEEAAGFLTDLSRVYWFVHGETFSLVNPGLAASPELAAFAETGGSAALTSSLLALPSVSAANATNNGSFSSGQSRIFTVSPDEDHPFLSLATMIEASNDAFVATEPTGVRLLAEDGTARSPADINDDLASAFAVWDAGSEANETPGVGPNTAANQVSSDSGDVDPVAGIRYYFDATNDLFVGIQLVSVLVPPGPYDPGEFELRIINNTDNAGGFPFTIAAGVLAITDEAASPFQPGMQASPVLESLAEDGDPSGFVLQMSALTNESVLQTTAFGPNTNSGDLLVSTSADSHILHFAAMLTPSNDTFLSTGPDGVDLYGGGDALLPLNELDDVIEDGLRIYDAGTERNQPAASGADMAPFQSGPAQGDSEGTQLIRRVTAGADDEIANEPVWGYPRLDQLIRVTVSPAR